MRDWVENFSLSPFVSLFFLAQREKLPIEARHCCTHIPIDSEREETYYRKVECARHVKRGMTLFVLFVNKVNKANETMMKVGALNKL